MRCRPIGEVLSVGTASLEIYFLMIGVRMGDVGVTGPPGVVVENVIGRAMGQAVLPRSRPAAA